MKKFALLFLTLIFLSLLVSRRTSARILQNQGSEKMAMAYHSVASNLHQEEEFNNLMGLEECEEKDEGCLQRRMAAEAHLDYIYTQKQKPKP